MLLHATVSTGICRWLSTGTGGVGQAPLTLLVMLYMMFRTYLHVQSASRNVVAMGNRFEGGRRAKRNMQYVSLVVSET